MNQTLKIAKRKKNMRGTCFATRHLVSAGLITVLFTLSLVAQTQDQKTFATPEDAVRALGEAAKSGNANDLLAIFGPEAAKIVSSGDSVDDKRNREVFVAAYEEGHRIAAESANRRILYIGNEDWPFPIPIVKKAGQWRFDTAAGAHEILYRRIGRNELSTIRVCLAYVEAQKEYASTGHDGKPAGLYASKFLSEPGKQDGLYWKTNEGAPPSPLGELAAEAATEGYDSAELKHTPFHGYYFRILVAQGKAAPGGARSYLSSGGMREGFALVASPAEYGNSGVMTFIVSQQGVVFEKDLGAGTSRLASGMTEYSPDTTWRRSIVPEE
jgi:hypothetical protein